MMPLATSARNDIGPVAIDAFDAFLETVADPRLYELVEFDIIMLTNPTEFHEEIVTNIASRLMGPIEARGCSTLIGGIRIQRDDDAKKGDKPRPDIVVRCGPITGKTYITDPIVVIEVLSPSTMDIDRGRKLEFYKSLETMQHIVLVYQDERRLEHHVRTPEGWVMSVLLRPDGVVRLDAVDFELSVSDVCRRLPL